MSSENREIAFGLFLVYVISFFYLIIIQHFHFSLVFLFSCNRPTIIMKSLKEIVTENVKDDSNLGRRSSIDLAGVVARILGVGTGHQQPTQMGHLVRHDAEASAGRIVEHLRRCQWNGTLMSRPFWMPSANPENGNLTPLITATCSCRQLDVWCGRLGGTLWTPPNDGHQVGR